MYINTTWIDQHMNTYQT